jgi:hypothetical protein
LGFPNPNLCVLRRFSQLGVLGGIILVGYDPDADLTVSNKDTVIRIVESLQSKLYVINLQ